MHVYVAPSNQSNFTGRTQEKRETRGRKKRRRKERFVARKTRDAVAARSLTVICTTTGDPSTPAMELAIIFKKLFASGAYNGPGSVCHRIILIGVWDSRVRRSFGRCRQFRPVPKVLWPQSLLNRTFIRNSGSNSGQRNGDLFGGRDPGSGRVV